MTRPRSSVLLAAAVFFLAILAAGPFPAAAAPERERYQAPPFMAFSSMSPQVLIVMAKNLKMFQQGYPGLLDLDGDGRVDTGFNPQVEYVGYFDSHSCYTYNGSLAQGLNDVFMAGDTSGYFSRVGPAVEDETAGQIQASRPAGLKKYVVSPRSSSGVCFNPSTNLTAAAGSRRTFSGNWLNFMTASRMDAIRKILYGGKRNIDTVSRTLLEMSFVPPDSTAWGSEVRSDDTWQEVTPLSAYYDVRKYTPFDKPLSRKAHFFARGSDLGKSNRYFPALRILLNADRTSFNAGGWDSVSEIVTVTEPYARYWDWVLVNRPLPDDRVLMPAARDTIQVYRLMVEACKPGFISPTEGCRHYPGLTNQDSDDVWKPGGLIQRYGESSSPMNFGLLTGTYAAAGRNQGGRIRNHVGPVLGPMPLNDGYYVPPVDNRTGIINPRGIIANIDSLRIAGRPSGADPAVWEGEYYHNTFSWGNPLGEMLFEGIRYLGGLPTPTYTYNNEYESDVPDSSILKLTTFSGTNSWKAQKPALADTACIKPVILLISDFSPERDGDNYTVDFSASLVAGTKLPAGVTTSNLPQSFNIKAYLETISKHEGLGTIGGSRASYSFAASAADTCLPKTMASLADVKGICPTAQSFEGTYSSVAAAYYAHIHDFNTSSQPGRVETGIDIYSVSLSPAFPELKFKIADPQTGKTVSQINILPANISSLVASGSTIMGFLNYMILEWDSDRNGETFHVKIKVNFSDSDMGGDWEGDGQVTYEIDLLTDARTPDSMRSGTPAAIDSGEASVRNAGPYYVFKNPASADSAADFISISPSQVKALLVKSSWTSQGTSATLAMGYTISGTSRDGLYLDLTMNNPDRLSAQARARLTPPGCQYAGGPTGTSACGASVTNLKSQAR
ncbi:MAG: hypothetical protein LBK52_03400, partial [Deltaproteobacteria bacterium]|nr:hypothetical protein [Deltaproteobacteria bacterium]